MIASPPTDKSGSHLAGILWMIAATMMLSWVTVISKTLTAIHPIE